MSFATFMATVSPAIRQAMLERYGSAEVDAIHLPYYSTVRFQAAFATGIIAPTTRKAFSYGVGQEPTAAGFAAAFGVATEAETNLLVPSTTNNGEDFIINGVRAFLTPDSEPTLAIDLWRHVFLELKIGARTTIPLGRLEQFPGGGGLRGVGQSALVEPELFASGVPDGGAGAKVSVMANGEPAVGNFREIDPIWWSGIANGVDSSLNVLATPKRQIQRAPGTARLAQQGAVELVDMVGAFTPPAADGARGTYVDVVIQLEGYRINRRSIN